MHLSKHNPAHYRKPLLSRVWTPGACDASYHGQGSPLAKNQSAQMAVSPRLRLPGVDLSWGGYFPTGLLPGKEQNHHLERNVPFLF